MFNPRMCPVCETEELVLTCEQKEGACQGCQHAAADLGIPVAELCRGCREARGFNDDRGEPELCVRCQAEADTEAAELAHDASMEW